MCSFFPKDLFLISYAKKGYLTLFYSQTLSFSLVRTLVRRFFCSLVFSVDLVDVLNLFLKGILRAAKLVTLAQKLIYAPSRLGAVKSVIDNGEIYGALKESSRSLHFQVIKNTPKFLIIFDYMFTSNESYIDWGRF